MFQYVPLGYDCSPAFASRDLTIRKFALPFDWVQSDYSQIINCIKDDFQNFHKNIRICNTPHGQRAIDSYGIQFPHDYPTVDNHYDNEIDYYNESTIVSNYTDFTEKILEKYQRRIKRFREIFTGEIPIIVLYRGSYHCAATLKNFLESKYNRSDIYFVVSTQEKSNDKKIICINTEIHNKWNDKTIWLEGINNAINQASQTN